MEIKYYLKAGELRINITTQYSQKKEMFISCLSNGNPNRTVNLSLLVYLTHT